MTFYDDVGFGSAGTRGRSNGRAVMRSTNSGVGFTDATSGAQDPLYTGTHPDLHAVALNPQDPKVAFVGSDGGVVRTDGTFVDQSPDCVNRALSAANLPLCQAWLASVPQHVLGLNDGLPTLQFQAISASPSDPRGELMGGTQDNGSLRYSGDSTWAGVAQGDGAASAFDVSDPSVRIHTFYNATPEVSYASGADGTWLDISGTLTGENVFFYAPMVGDPRNGGTVFFGIDSLSLSSPEAGEILRDLAPGFASGELKPFRIKPNAIYPLERAAEAYVAVLGSSRDRLIFQPNG